MKLSSVMYGMCGCEGEYVFNTLKGIFLLIRAVVGLYSDYIIGVRWEKERLFSNVKSEHIILKSMMNWALSESIRSVSIFFLKKYYCIVESSRYSSNRIMIIWERFICNFKFLPSRNSQFYSSIWYSSSKESNWILMKNHQLHRCPNVLLYIFIFFVPSTERF